jgi:arylsulfatase A-like enzyme
MTTTLRCSFLVFLAVLLADCTKTSEPAGDRLPNIVIFYADDLGYGDVGSYGAATIPTPNIDRLAQEGIRFTDAHSSAATCTPSRFSLLTGEYGFRAQARILPGDAPALIRPGQPTLPAMLQGLGYATAVVGKWHLGLGDGSVDWNAAVKPGPLEIGFDYSFLMPATGDRVPTVYLENHHVVGLDPDDPLYISYRERIGDRPVGTESPELLRVQTDRQHLDTIVNGISRIGFMAGGRNAEWVDEEFADVFTGKAVEFIRANADRPFFLFHSYHDPHQPRLPHPRFQGATEHGPRGDVIVQMDWMTGEIMRELEALGVAENTLVIFTSDNGPVLNDGYEDEAIERLGDHRPAGPFRGGKYSIFEAGTRVPTIVHWPGKVTPGNSAALVSQVDFYASIASLLGATIEDGEAIDSEDVMDALLGKSGQGRETLFVQSIQTVALRKGQYKYIRPVTELGYVEEVIGGKGVETGAALEPQRYGLSGDIGERNNLAAEFPELVSEMEAAIVKIEQQ